jgi:hypothetical protein
MAGTQLKYHKGAAKELYGKARAQRRTPPEVVREIASRLGGKMPAALREWLTYFGDLRTCAGQDNPIPLDRLGQPRAVRLGVVVDFVAGGHLPLMFENQGCCLWALVLDGSEDPPVVQAGNWHAANPLWESVADRFSTFTCARVWSQRCVFQASLSWMSLSGRFDLAARAYLRSHYREGPTVTDWPCEVHHHFEHFGAYLWVMGEQWMAGGESLWELERMTREVWWLVAGSMEYWGWDTVGPMLERVREKPPAYPGPGWEAVFGDDLAARFASGRWLYSPSDDALTPPALDELLDHFDERQRRTAGEGVTAHWLERGDQRLYILTEDYRREKAESAWWLHAEGEESLRELARRVGRWGRLEQTLKAKTEQGKAVL